MGHWSARGNDLSLGRKLRDVNWGLVLLIGLIASVGFATLYSAGGGSIDPWADRQMARFAIGTTIMIVIAVTDRSEEHTSELQSLMRISYAVFCLKKKKQSRHIQ